MKIKAVTLWGDSWNSIFHIPMDVEPQKIGEDKIEVEGIEFQIIKVHKEGGLHTILETSLIGRIPPANVATFLRGWGIITIPSSHILGSWCFYTNIASESTPDLERLRKELKHEPTTEDLEAQIAKLVRKRWHR